MKALQPHYVFVRRYLRTIPEHKDGFAYRTDAYVNGLFVAALVWSSRDVVDRVEIGPDRMILRVLFGFRAVNVGWRDIISVSDREGDGFLRVRNRQGKSYLLSPELSDFAGLRDMLTAAVTS